MLDEFGVISQNFALKNYSVIDFNLNESIVLYIYRDNIFIVCIKCLVLICKKQVKCEEVQMKLIWA